MRRFLRGAVLITIGLIASDASADPAAEARFFDEMARRNFQRGRYDEALGQFLIVQETAPNARTLYNIAICAEFAGLPGLAYGWLGEYLAGEDDDEERRTDAARRRDQLRASLALVLVESDPPGAEIVVDRRELGVWGRAPREIPLAAGAHEVVLSLAGHHDARIRVEVILGRQQQAQATLRPRLGAVRIDSAVAGTEIEMRRDGVVVGALSAGEELELPVGRYLATATAGGRAAVSIEVPVREGALERRVLTPGPAPAATGRLLVSTGAVRARVFIDGEERAETPATIAELPVGEHAITLVAEGRLRWRGRVTVDEGRASHLAVTMRDRR